MSESQSQKQPDAEKITRAVERTKSRAEDYVNDPVKARELVKKAALKAKSQEGNKGPLADIWNYLTASVRLIKAYSHHEYVDIPWGSLVLATVGIIYFVTPLDMVFDFLPLLGFVDDAAVIAFVVGQVKKDLDKFLIWEAGQKSTDQIMDVP